MAEGGNAGTGWAAALADPARPWSRRADGAAAAALALLTLAARLAQASTTLYTVDSVLFALATDGYDLMALRPHPPGYPLFVAAGKALLPLAGGHNEAFVLQSALWSAAAVALLYGLVRAWGSRRAAGAAALLFAFAPAFAFNGTVALSYTAEAAAMLGVALLAWRARRSPSPGRLLALGAAWALAVGIRQSLLLFLAPVVALALLGPPPLRWRADFPALARRTAVAAAAALATALAWLLPMARASGGLAEVRRATRLQGAHVVFADAVWERGWAALREHADRLAWFLHWEAGTLLPVAAALAAAGWAARRRRGAAAEPGPWPRGAGAFLAAWLAPAFLFYLLVFDGWERGPIGYVLTVLPGLYAAALLLADHGLRRLQAAQRPPVRRAVAALCVPLLLLPLPALASQAADLVEDEAHAHDRWAEAWQRLEQDYPANSTAILAWQSWAHVKWHFPDHLAWTYFPAYDVEGQEDWALVFAMRHRRDEGRFIEMYLEGPGRPEHPIPPEVRTVVVFDFQLAGENGEARRLDPALAVEERRLSNGWRILAFEADAAHPTVESLFTPEALGPGARAPREPR